MVKNAPGFAFVNAKLPGGKICCEITLTGNAVGQHQHIQIMFLRKKGKKLLIGSAVFHDRGVALLGLRHKKRIMEVARNAGLHDASVKVKVIIDRYLLGLLCTAPIHVFIGCHGAKIGFAGAAAGGGNDFHHMPCQLLCTLNAFGGRRACKFAAQRGFCVGFPISLPPKKHVERDAECVCDFWQQFRVRGAAAFPARDCLTGDEERLTEILLRHANLLAAAGDVFTELIACHACLASYFGNSIVIIPYNLKQCNTENNRNNDSLILHNIITDGRSPLERKTGNSAVFRGGMSHNGPAAFLKTD